MADQNIRGATEVKLLISLSETLIVTPVHLRQMRANKAIGTMVIRPQDFIALTTPNQNSAQEMEESVLPISKYNEYAREGENIIMPFLQVSYTQGKEAKHKLGKVRDHEGRHRALALIKEHESNMIIGIILSDRGHSMYREENWNSKTRTHSARDLTVADIPDIFIGQYNSRVKIDMKAAKQTFRLLR